MRRQVVIHWGISSFFGFGVYGLNLALAWARDPDVRPVCSLPVDPRQIAVDPLRRRAIEPFLRDSAAFQATFGAAKDGRLRTDAPMLTAVDDAFVMGPAAGGVRLTGDPMVAVCFFDSARLSPEVVRRASAYPLVVAGCTWNERVLRAHGVARVTTILQGVDPTLFHPAPRLGVLGDRFAVFSGGKLERRKGQDIVLAAFRRFAERRPDALLVTAWHSPWPQMARSLDESGLAAPVVFDGDGRVDVAGWAQASGVAAGQVLDLGPVPNAALPPLLREMDVGVFPNRSEGGTNLVAMECMACGVPTILSANTGHLDLIGEANGYVLERQAAAPGQEGVPGVGGWGESDVDEVVARLEAAYADREDARRRGLRGAETLSKLTWARTADALKAAVLAL